MWLKQRYYFQDHVKNIHNETVKPFRCSILQYGKCIHDMHELYRYLPTPSKKGDMVDQAKWRVQYCDFTEYEICVATKDSVPTSMQDDMENKDAGFCYLPHKEWCDILSSLEAKDNIKRAAAPMNIIANHKILVVHSDSDAIPKVPRKKKSMIDMLLACKQTKKN